MSPEGALLAAGALHVGFQATVSLVVYSQRSVALGLCCCTAM